MNSCCRSITMCCHLFVPGPRTGDNGSTHMYAMYAYYVGAPFLGLTRSIYFLEILHGIFFNKEYIYINIIFFRYPTIMSQP
jgi:hypothetical protein